MLRGPESEMTTLRWDNQNLVGAVFPLLNPEAHPGYQRTVPLKDTDDRTEIPMTQSQTQDEILLVNTEDCDAQVIQDPIFDGILFLLQNYSSCQHYLSMFLDLVDPIEYNGAF